MTDTENNEIVDENEAQLLNAMSVDELPVYKAFAGKELEPSSKKAKMFDIVEAIKTVCDPEIPINVYDLGLIYKINQEDNGNLHIDMSLTAPGCPVAGYEVRCCRENSSGFRYHSRVSAWAKWNACCRSA